MTPVFRRQELRRLARVADGHRGRRRLAALRQGAAHDRQDGQEGQLRRGRRRRAERRGDS